MDQLPVLTGAIFGLDVDQCEEQAGHPEEMHMREQGQ
jgi:hypothetical protein